MGLLTRLWKRHVLHRPDCYRFHVLFPLRRSADRPTLGSVREFVDELEAVCGGRLDVYAESNGLVARSDSVPREQFELEAFERVLERLAERYRATHVVTPHSNWLPCDRGLERSFVFVPVKPLFHDPPRETEGSRLTVRD